MSEHLLYILVAILATLVGALAVYAVFLSRENRRIRLEGKRQEDIYKRLNDRLDDVHRTELNPHLLKNSLNAILSHAYQTYFTMDKLAQVLDYVLYESPNKLVSPKEEVAFALNLIEINKIKLSPLFDIQVKVDVEEEHEPLFSAPVMIPLITIDLIENAFKHADIQSANSFIAIAISFENGILEITVNNTISKKSPLAKRKGGIGSKALEERLMRYYAGRHELHRFVENDIYSAYLQIQLYES
ncbi:histidine kinase [Sphingobacterium paucimobilis]|uniref:Signal transduction histidine kinase internal region domain-containing protein n=1 Tax=Sphingobacterium paucimobilis HER1398 TaxID=1346330 RepID=U2IX11_9SPHI|nr:histidine kinase [Sphingobacterium paucimobilis]ERJ57234.1 hypothetical protein M472_00495 [Sphingobacterium paucimobilis HER1398]